MLVLRNTGGLVQTNSFLLADEETREAVLFDAPDNTTEPLLAEAKRRGLNVIGLWLTHGHFDHIADHPQLSAHFPEAKVLIHRLDDPKLRRPNMMAMILPIKLTPRQPDGYVQDGQSLKLGTSEVRVLHTPGHSPGHVMYHFPAEKLLVGGDLIIMGAVGRTDFPDSDPAALNASIRKVMELPADTVLLPGHGESSTLGEELRNNPYVREAMEESETP